MKNCQAQKYKHARPTLEEGLMNCQRKRETRHSVFTFFVWGRRSIQQVSRLKGMVGLIFHLTCQTDKTAKYIRMVFAIIREQIIQRWQEIIEGRWREMSNKSPQIWRCEWINVADVWTLSGVVQGVQSYHITLCLFGVGCIQLQCKYVTSNQQIILFLNR